MFEGLPEYLKIDPLATRSVMYANQGNKPVPIATFYSQNRIIDTWNQVNQLTKDAAVSTEDPRFYSHGAIDVQGTRFSSAGRSTAAPARHASSASPLASMNVRAVSRRGPALVSTTTPVMRRPSAMTAVSRQWCRT